ncbi:MAG: flagellar biosynthesis protein FlhA [Defluviitaleaceae bacterium]|nr:flagellar biosynthesis protein FlhA [Defluviitaleaceae bacterium]
MRFAKEALFGVAIIAVILILLVPPPTWLLDLLLTVNIMLGVIILIDAIYSKEPLDMSIFPTVLLVTTLFRVILSISSMRLILGEGFAGNVISTFGDFVAGGNMVVGIVIFLALVLVNFIVITKGAERVSEVTARFTLDAMPGKQMAIDADLNTGLIDEEEAKARRKKIQDEASFYGSMDGATKFVKGDAIFTIIATLINIIAGVILGATGEATGVPLPIGEAFQIYTLMTIGDGLVSILPAILISLATGMIVTKATNESDITEAISTQIFSRPLAFFIAGASLLLLSLTPMPTHIFLPLGIVLILLGFRLSNKQKLERIEEEIAAVEAEHQTGAGSGGAPGLKGPENVTSLLNVDSILLVFGYGLIPLVDYNQGGDLVDRVIMIRRQIAIELGAVIPPIRMRDDIKLGPNQYRILIKGVEIAGGEILFDHYMAMNPGYVEEEIEGIETVEPYLGLPALWINERQREKAEAMGYTVVDAPAIIATHLTEVIRDNLADLLTRQDTQMLIETVRETHPILVEELMPKLMSIGDIQKVLGNLLSEGIAIRDLVTILETLADYAVSTRDTDMLTEYVRQALKRSISARYFDNEVNTVITLDPELEQTIMTNVQQTEQGSYIALDPVVTGKIHDSLKEQVSKLASMGLTPVILTSPIVRTYFKRLVEQSVPDLVVLSYNEIESNIDIQSIGMVTVN